MAAVFGLATAPAAPAHYLPCTIKHAGPADVSGYFFPEEVEQVRSEDGPGLGATRGGEEGDGQPPVAGPEGATYRAAFRGRGLAGSHVALPSGRVGAVLEKRLAEEGGGWRVSARFEAPTQWALGSHPEVPGGLGRALGWLPIADHVHEPVSDEDVLQELEKFQAKGAGEGEG